MLTHSTSAVSLATLYLFFAATLALSILAKDHPLQGAQEQQLKTSFKELDRAKQTSAKMSPIKTQVPVIGVLTQVLRDYKRFTNKHHLHLASSYVKWIESAGAQALPILLNQDDAYYKQVFQQTNGLLLPGGDNLLDPHKSTPMMLAARKLYKLAVEANNRGDFYPIWGTCLGLELLSVLSSGKNVLDSCNAQDVVLRTQFVERGKLFEPNKNANLKVLAELDYPKLIMDTLKSLPVTYHYHQKCLTDAGLKRANLQDFYRPLAYSSDKNGLKFVSIMEAREYPFYGVQFHPEKSAFEFTLTPGHLNVAHSRDSIEVSRYLGDFFIRQAQQSGHKAVDKKQLERKLIYAYKPMYTAPLEDIYEQRYLFPFNKSNNYKSKLEILRETPQGARLESTANQQGINKVQGVSPIKNPHLTIEFVENLLAYNEEVSEEVDNEEISEETTFGQAKPPIEVELAVYNRSHPAELEEPDEPEIKLPNESLEIRNSEKKKKKKAWF